MNTFSIVPNILTRRSNAMWDILLGISEEAKVLTGSTLTTKSVRAQNGMFGHPENQDHTSRGALGYRKSPYRNLLFLLRIATGEVLRNVTLTRKCFMDVPDILMCRVRNILIIVEGRRPHCWTTGHLSKLCSGKSPVSPPQMSKTS